ncbi:ureidoglycolate lyase [Candidatus Spongiihabitans sp.]|uniref:ureidoglycolate lyase n=1 Tax=Candidatus Spongiihabitans sp. TaxID=3101308 RepID=UPI003C7D6CBA
MAIMELKPVPLTAQDFKPFGQVIELAKLEHYAKQISINHGLTTRFHDLLNIDANDQGGRPTVNIFRTSPLPLPHKIKAMERHPLGSQGFIPMGDQPFLVLVGRPARRIEERLGFDDLMRGDDLTLFLTNGRQGINLKKNTWHHFQIVLDSTQDFIVIDRAGEGDNLEEIEVEDDVWIGDLNS